MLVTFDSLPYDYFNPHYYHQQEYSTALTEESSSSEGNFPKPITIQGQKIHFELDDSCQLALKLEDEYISTVKEVIDRLPPPKSDKKEDIKNWVTLICFLNDYQEIKEPDQFKHEYKNRTYKEACRLNYPSNSLCYQGMHVEEICSPRVEDNVLIFYALKRSNPFTPYRITVSFQKNQIAPVAEEVLLNSLRS